MKKYVIIILSALLLGITHLSAQTFNFVLKAGNITKIYPISDIQMMYFSELRDDRTERMHIFFNAGDSVYFDMKEIKEITLTEDIEKEKYLMKLEFNDHSNKAYSLKTISKIIFTSKQNVPVKEKSLVLYPVANYPNPFKDKIRIKFSLANSSKININIIDMSGRTLRELGEKDCGPGENEIIWDGKDNKGSIVGSGIYFALINTGSELIISKMIKIK